MFASFRILWVSFFSTMLMMTLCVADGMPARHEESSEMLQFASAGHVLGFGRCGIYVTNGNYVLKERFVGAKDIHAKAVQTHSTNGQFHLLETVSYSGLWEGITLVYDNPPNGILRTSYYVKPWGNTDQIVLKYNAPVHLDTAGNLIFQFEKGSIIVSAPIAWQTVEGKRMPVDVRYRLEKFPTRVRFRLGYYNPALPLTIDPILKWNTFMGSSSSDQASAIATDGSGNVYVAGHSYGSWGSPVNAFSSAPAAFVAKLNSAGELQWNTFMGASGGDYARAIDVDGSGNVYVTGLSFFGWGDPVSPHSGGGYEPDAFIAKLNSYGGSVWHTFIGGESIYVTGRAIAYGGGDIYVAGYSRGTWGSPINGYAGEWDAFVAKIKGGTIRPGIMLWNTFLGSSDSDFGTAITADGSGNVFVAGSSESGWGHPKNAYAGDSDAFAAKLNSSGETVWTTFLGSSHYDYGTAIALDSGSNVYIAGDSNLPWGSPINDHTGGNNNLDAFVAKLRGGAIRPGILMWNTFMGSTSHDRCKGIALDKDDNAYVTGESYDTWGHPSNAYNGGVDTFIAKLKSNGVRQGNTFVGSSSEDYGYAIAVDNDRNVYVSGKSQAIWGSPVDTYTGDWDAFVAKLLGSSVNPGLPLLLLDANEQ